MATKRRPPGQVRDAILETLRDGRPASIDEIHAAVSAKLGPVARSSVRSYLRLNSPKTFQRVGKGTYRFMHP